MAYHKKLQKRSVSKVEKSRKENEYHKILVATFNRKQIWKHIKETKKLTPVTAVPVQAQARGSKYHGAFAIIKIPNA